MNKKILFAISLSILCLHSNNFGAERGPGQYTLEERAAFGDLFLLMQTYEKNQPPTAEELAILATKETDAWRKTFEEAPTPAITVEDIGPQPATAASANREHSPARRVIPSDLGDTTVAQRPAKRVKARSQKRRYAQAATCVASSHRVARRGRSIRSGQRGHRFDARR